MDNLLSRITKNKQTCIFISPHLDDAMLSAGGLIQQLSKKTNVVVINVFTESSDEKQTLSAWKFVKDMGYQKPSVLFGERRDEDKKAFADMNITPINLGFPDALWRKKKGFVLQLLGSMLPELMHVYPTYRFHIAGGNIAKADKDMVPAFTQKIIDIVQKEKHPIIFSPLGIGNHVDHVFVRELCTTLFASNLVYWSDFPYNDRENNEGTTPKGYEKVEFPVDMKVKTVLIKAYKTQVSGLFPNGIIPNHKEIFFLPKGKLTIAYNKIL